MRHFANTLLSAIVLTFAVATVVYAAQLRMDQLPLATTPTDADIFGVEQAATLPMRATTLGQLRTYLSSIITGVTPSAVSITGPAAPGSIIATFSGVCTVVSCSGANFALATQAGCTGAGNGPFVMSSAGVLTAGNTAIPAGSYNICEQVSLNGFTPFFVPVTVTVTVATPLTLVFNPSSASIPCSLAPGTFISTASASGGDGNAVTYSLSAGDTTDFAINSATGAVTVGANGIATGNCSTTQTVTATATQS